VVNSITNRELDGIIKSLAKPLRKAQQAVETFESEIKALQDKILAAGGKKLQGQQTCIADIETQLDSASRTITRNKVQIKAAKKAIADGEKSIAKASQEITQYGLLPTTYVAKHTHLEQANATTPWQVDGAT